MVNNSSNFKTRIAPSPTGHLHIGTARTALFNYLLAKQNKGNFVLRIEDTDKERSKSEYENDIVENLKWLGLVWDEGPFRQSERSSVYQKYIQNLLDSGFAFWCYHSKEELEKEKQKQTQNNEAPRHICDHDKNPPKNSSAKGIIRFKTKPRKIIFNDLIRGELSFDSNLLGDFSIAKDENTPLYNLAVVIDDSEMEISHVVRGEDHIPNTPKQILIYQALGLDVPEFAHLPLILGPDKSKLSKRHGAVSVSSYKEQGYLSKSLINFMAFLGWNPGDEREFFNLEELTKEFSIERVQKSAAVFDFERLDWINGYYIRKLNLDDLTKKAIPYLEKDNLIEPKEGTFIIKNNKKEVDFNFLKQVVGLEQERLKKINEIGELTEFFFVDKPEYEPELLVWKKLSLNEVKHNLELVKQTLEQAKKFDQENLQGVLMPLAEKYGKGDLLWPLRVSLTGKKASPGPFEIMEVLGRKKTLERINYAIKKIEDH
jgi:glutamyl-tRNA synthetase